MVREQKRSAPSAMTDNPTNSPVEALLDNHQAKKQKSIDTRPQFPQFYDGDTVVSLTQDKSQDFILYGSQLRQISGYFACFSEWPKRFELVSGEDGCLLKPATEDSPIPTSQSHPSVGDNHDVQMHRLLFQILYHQPISFPDSDIRPEKVLLEVVKLVAIYDCLDHVKGQIIAEIYTGDCFGAQKITERPDIFLNIANHLQNKTLFLEALQHVVGQTFQRNEDFDSLDDDVYDVVSKCINDLDSKVQETCSTLYMLGATHTTFPDFTASSIFQRYLLTNLATKRVGSGEMFATLKFISKLGSGIDLLEATSLGRLVDDAGTISNSIRTAIGYVEDNGDFSDADQPFLDNLYNAQDLQLRPDRIKATLKSLVTKAQLEIQPLLGIGTHYGYFTCVDFNGIYPWEETFREPPDID